MPYYLRLFSQNNAAVPLEAISASLPEGCILDVETTDGDWKTLLISAPNGDPICELERTDETLTAEEISEFRDELASSKPVSNAEWASRYLASTAALFACQVLKAGFDDEFGAVPAKSLWAIRRHLGGGIIQADGEGFSNEAGYHITWSFSDHVSGPWWMAIREGDGWIAFQMDLANREHRRDFCEGRAPPDVEPKRPS